MSDWARQGEIFCSGNICPASQAKLEGCRECQIGVTATPGPLWREWVWRWPSPYDLWSRLVSTVPPG